jgi:hypothetical protein
MRQRTGASIVELAAALVGHGLRGAGGVAHSRTTRAWDLHRRADHAA